MNSLINNHRHNDQTSSERIEVTYEGKRQGVPSVCVDGQPLDPRFDIWPFSFDGFDWGSGGAGDKQLALAILANHLDDEKTAFDLCDQFNWNVISSLPMQGWKLTSSEIDGVLKIDLLG